MGGHKTQVWELNIHLYNSVNFGECIGYRRYAVHLCREAAEINQHLITFQSLQSEANVYNFNKCFKNQSSKWEKYTEGIIIHKEYLMQRGVYNNHPTLSKIISLINQSS